jgi:homospermidine synthase
MDIERARTLVPGENVTSLQVAGSMLGAIVLDD